MDSVLTRQRGRRIRLALARSKGRSGLFGLRNNLAGVLGGCSAFLLASGMLSRHAGRARLSLRTVRAQQLGSCPRQEGSKNVATVRLSPLSVHCSVGLRSLGDVTLVSHDNVSQLAWPARVP